MYNLRQYLREAIFGKRDAFSHGVWLRTPLKRIPVFNFYYFIPVLIFPSSQTDPLAAFLKSRFAE